MLVIFGWVMPGNRLSVVALGFGPAAGRSDRWGRGRCRACNACQLAWLPSELDDEIELGGWEIRRNDVSLSIFDLDRTLLAASDATSATGDTTSTAES